MNEEQRLVQKRWGQHQSETLITNNGVRVKYP